MQHNNNTFDFKIFNLFSEELGFFTKRYESGEIHVKGHKKQVLYAYNIAVLYDTKLAMSSTFTTERQITHYLQSHEPHCKQKSKFILLP